MGDLWQQNPELTAYIEYMEREMTRAYIAATMTWSCPKPSEQKTDADA